MQAIGEVGTKLSSLEFGPDGQLYRTGFLGTAGFLYRIDTTSGAGTLVGNTGLSTLAALALRQPQKQDCVVIQKRGQSLQAINVACNSGPAAVRRPALASSTWWSISTAGSADTARPGRR